MAGESGALACGGRGRQGLEGIVIQAAAKVGGDGPRPGEWRKLNFSEGI